MNDTRFALLVQALSERIGSPLDPASGMVALADDAGGLRLIVELSSAQDSIYAIAPFLPYPEPVALGETALRLLQLNADRGALGNATIAGDATRRQFCLIEALSLDLEPVPFIEAVEHCLAVADTVREAVAGGADGASPPEPLAGMFQRA